jgi:hypothetical protein
MLIMSNRILEQAGMPAARLSRRFVPGSDQLALAQVEHLGGQWQLSRAVAACSDAEARKALVSLMNGPKPVLVYLHGNNNSPESCYQRCADLAQLYGVEVLGFSWPSEGLLANGQSEDGGPLDDPDGEEALAAAKKKSAHKKGGLAGKARRYHLAKANAGSSTDAMARFFRLVAAAQLHAKKQRFSVAAHSLGCHFLKRTIEDEGSSAPLAAAHHIVLLAACCPDSGHTNWVSGLAPQGRVFITYNRDDWVLFGARVVDDGERKLGAEPATRASSDRVRYVSFTNAGTTLSGHGYFIKLAGGKKGKAAAKLFGRIFASLPDVAPGEDVGDVYPVRCEADGRTCYMGNQNGVAVADLGG